MTREQKLRAWLLRLEEVERRPEEWPLVHADRLQQLKRRVRNRLTAVEIHEHEYEEAIS